MEGGLRQGRGASLATHDRETNQTHHGSWGKTWVSMVEEDLSERKQEMVDKAGLVSTTLIGKDLNETGIGNTQSG